MNTRRKFLVQGSMATTALLIADPFKTFANAVSPVTGFSMDEKKVVLLHTGNYSDTQQRLAATQISALKKNTGNLLLVHAGKKSVANSMLLNYDASIHSDSSIYSQYQVIYKGDIKIGIIKALETEKDLLNTMNSLSTYLKKEKKCQLVVCLSQLGYKNKFSLDDLKLAENSSHIDIIITGHATNYPKHPMIVHNSNKEEVIIDCSTGNGYALGNIEISFDNKLNKKFIDFNNLLTRIA